MIRTSTIAWTWGWIGLVVGLGLPSPLQAQPGNNSDRQTLNVFRQAPRELVLRLSRARKAIDNQEYNDAVVELGRLLAELEQPIDQGPQGEPAESQDYFVGPRGESGTHVSLKTEAQRLIGSMPAKGREWYELQFGAEARKLLGDAAATGDIEALTTASRRFFHTKAGYEATLLLGRHYMDHGQPLAAALCFKRLVDSPAGAAFEPELSVLLATCWYQAGMPDKSRQSLASLSKRSGAQQLNVAGRKVEVAKDEQRGVAWLGELIGTRRLAVAESLEWLLFRGNATRTATASGDVPLATPRWRVPTLNNPNDERVVDQLAKKMASAGTPALPGLHPLAVGEFVLMRSADILLGVDFKTGKRVWQYPWDEMESSPQGFSQRPMVAGTNLSLREIELKQRLWEDAPFGQLSSDGQAVYFIHGLGFASPNGQNIPMAIVGPAGRINRMAPNSGNRLVAVDVRRQGKLLWEIGDPQGTGNGERRLAGAFFLGAPLPLQGLLYALVEVAGEVRLVAINSRDGSLEWQQQLAQLEARNILMDPNRRLAGATPSFADGVLVCPTSAGAVVAVDIATRTLLWGFQYQQAAPDSRQGAIFFPRTVTAMQSRQFGQRWADATVTIHDGRVLVTPLESDEMYCLDLLTGKQLWPAQKRNELLYVGGVYDGKAIMVGKNSVVAVRLDDGKPAWPSPVEFPEGGLVSGRGFQSDHHYYAPTSASHIVRVDLKTGKIDQQVRTERPLGNLICYRDEIISHGVDGLSSYPMVGPLRKSVAERLEKNPQDSQALARLAELQSYDGQRDAALATLRRAAELNPRDETLKGLLVRNMLEALQADFARHRQLAAEVESLVEQPVQREKFLRLMATGLQQAGEVDAAFSMYLKLAAADAARSRSAGDGPAALEDLSRRHSVRRDRWIQAQMASLYRQVTPEQRQRMDAALEQRQREAATGDTVASLREFVRYYGFHPRAIGARFDLARRLVEMDYFIEAEVLLAGLDRHADRSIAATATVETTRLLLKAHQYEQASSYSKRLLGELSEVVCQEGLTGRQWQERFQAEVNDKQQSLVKRAEWPYGKVAIKEGERIGNASYGRITQLAILGSEGPLPEGTSITFDSQQGQILTIRDGYGREMTKLSIARQDGSLAYMYWNNNAISHARAIGHLILAHMGTEVVAISGLRGGKSDEPLRWRADVVQRVGENDGNPRPVVTKTSSTPWGGVKTTLSDHQGRPIGFLGPCNASGVFYQKNRELVCLDPLSGEVVWSRTDFATGAELYGDEDVLIVVPPESKELIVLSALDGQELGRRPIETTETRWAGCGRRILAWTQSQGQLTLRLTDGVTGDKLFEQKFPDGSRGTLVQAEDVAVLQPDGQFVLLSLRDGQARIRVGLEPEPGLTAVHVLRSQDDYLVIADGPPKSGTTQVTSVPGALNSVVVNGRIYQFDRRTGKARWTTPATVEQFGLPLEQPADLPVVVFMRNAANRGRNQSALLVLDRRDGRLLLQKDEIPVQANFSEIVGKPESATVSIQMGNRTFDLTFTSEPVPPGPPAQLGSASSAGKPNEETSGGILGTIFNALGKGPPAAAGKPAEAAKPEKPPEAPPKAKVDP